MSGVTSKIPAIYLTIFRTLCGTWRKAMHTYTREVRRELTQACIVIYACMYYVIGKICQVYHTIQRCVCNGVDEMRQLERSNQHNMQHVETKDLYNSADSHSMLCPPWWLKLVKPLCQISLICHMICVCEGLWLSLGLVHLLDLIPF